MRLLRAQASAAPADAAIDPRLPLVLVAPGQGGARIVSLNRAARQSRPRRGRASLQRPLQGARPAVRATPIRPPMPPPCASSPCGACAIRPSRRPGTRRAAPTACSSTSRAARISLGGEAQLLADLATRLRAFGLVPRTGHRRHGGRRLGHRARMVREARGQPDRAPGRANAPAPRPAACRAQVSPASLALMRRLGFARIGEIMRQPRAPVRRPLRARAAAAASTRRWGMRPSRSCPSSRRPPIARSATFLEPIIAEEHVLEAATRLLGSWPRTSSATASAPASCASAVPSGRRGAVARHRARRAEPGRGAHRPADRPRLYRLGRTLEADFGFEAAAVHVLVAEPLAERQDTARPRRGGCRARGARPADRSPAAAAGSGAVCRLPRTRATCPSAPCTSTLRFPPPCGGG